MNPEQSQEQNDMTPEDAKASLGIATFLQGQMMPQEAVEGDMEGQEAPQEEQMQTQPETPPIDIDALKNEITAIMQEAVKEIKKESKSMIKDELKKLLDEDGNETENKTSEDPE